MNEFSSKGSVFRTTEVNSMVPETIPQKKFKSILDVDPQNLNCIPIFSEQATLKAMMKLGYQPDDLVKLSGLSAERIPGNEEIRKRILSEIEQRRLAAFDKIKFERNNILQEQQKTERSNQSNAQKEGKGKQMKKSTGKTTKEILSEEQKDFE